MAGCTQEDEAPEATGIPLPPDTYPLQIGSVTVTTNGQPWTRLTDNGNTTSWEPEDRIVVSLGDQEGIYTYTSLGTWLSDSPLYWESTAPQDVNAWHPTETLIDLSDQTDGLAYVLKAEPVEATYNQSTPISLTFTHQLAKVRVVLSGTQAGQVETVKVFGYTSCTHDQGTISTDGAQQSWITMHKVDDTTYEANVVPGTIDLKNFIQINDQTATINDGFPTTLVAATMYTINLTVGEPLTDITEDNATISDDGHYRVSGNFGHTITVTGGKPNIYLVNANINVNSGNAISIKGNATPTIHVMGDNSVSSSNGAGIYVAENSSVTITGRDREDVLTARGGNGGSGIGGNHATCGNIEISNMTVHAYGSDEDGHYLSAGIGGSGDNGCGTITIDNATIFAYGASDGWAGNMSTPGIGGGLYANAKGTYSTITIKNNSQVSVQRGSSRSDYIGSGGSTNNHANSPNGIDATVDETSTVTPLN